MHLTGLLLEIAEVIGEREALALAAAVGGKMVWIPKTVSEDHWLADVVGLDAAQQLCSHFIQENSDGKVVGRLRVLIPLGPFASPQLNRELARQAITSGMSARDTALLVGFHERHVRRIRAVMRAEGLLPPIKKRVPSEVSVRHAQAREALLAGSSIREVALEFGLRHKTLIRIQSALDTEKAAGGPKSMVRLELK